MIRDLAFFIVGVFAWAAYMEDGVPGAIPIALLAAICAIPA